MVLTPSIPAQSTALNAELLLSSRRMYGRIEVDWNRNGLYDHAYSDLTELWVSSSGDRSLVTDMPDEVSTPDGYASGQLTVTLAGTTRAGVGAASLFDPNNRSSPVFGKRILGAPIRYSRVTQTPIGDVALPVFTGFIRQAPFQRMANQVDITAADHLDLVTAAVTLPLWAVPVASPDATYNYVSAPLRRPFRATWCIEEMLRQAGRPVGPQPRADAVAFATCSGSMFPSFGYGNFSDYQQLLFTDLFGHPLAHENNWVVAPFGVAPNVSQTDLTDLANGRFTANRSVTVTTNGSGLPDSRIGIGCYFYMDSSASAAFPSQVVFYIGQFNRSEEFFSGTYEPPGSVTEFINMQVSSNGNVVVTVQESFAMAGFKTWKWDTTYALSNGWHYFNAIYNFASGSVTATLTIDGVSQSMTQTSSPAGGFRYRSPAPTTADKNGGVLRDGKLNVVDTYCSGPPMHYAQVYAGDNTLAYSSQQVTKPLLANGKPPAVVNPSGLDIFYIPDVYKKNPWDVIKDISNAFYAGLYVDEFGTVNWVEHFKLRVDVGIGALNAISLTDQQMDELVTLPSDDSQRNSLAFPWSFVNAEEGPVWEQRNARDRAVNVGGVLVATEPMTNTISVSNRLEKVSADPPTTSALEPDARTGWFSAVQQDDPSLDPSAPDWGGGSLMNTDQRSFSMNWSGGSFGEALFIGSFRNANQASWRFAGAKYSAPISGVEVVEDSVSIAAIGRRSLEMRASPWMSIPDTARVIGDQLLDDTTVPSSIISPLTVPADPRRQLLDVLRVTNEMGTSGAFYGQIIGKAWSDRSTGEFLDILKLRMTSTPGAFILDDNEFGVLDSPTPIG